MSCPKCGGVLHPDQGILNCQCGYWCFDPAECKLAVSKYMCRQCNQIFGSNEELLEHEKNHILPKEILSYDYRKHNDVEGKKYVLFPVCMNVIMQNGVVQTYVRSDIAYQYGGVQYKPITLQKEKKVKKHGIRNLFNFQLTTRKGGR